MEASAEIKFYVAVDEATDEVGAVIHVQLRLRKDGTVVLEWVVDQDVDWDPADLRLIDGTAIILATGTTRAGALTAGQTVRIALRWDDTAALPQLQWRGAHVEIA